ncbi:MAG: hypothetical protein AABX85_03190 [Nanoarchaeota archaeon]
MVKNKRKNGQAWSFDLMIGIVIFVAALSLLFFYSINYKAESEDILNAMQYDGNAVADILLSEGYPKNWNKDDVIVPGILSNNKIDEDKLKNLSIINYEEQRSLMHTKYDFCFNFSDSMPASLPYCMGKQYNDPNNLFFISRMVIYKNKSSMLNIYIWK